MGYHQRVIAQPDMRVIGGHQRIKALKELGITEIQVLVSDRELTPEEFKQLLIQDNLPFGEWEFELLKTDFSFKDLGEWGMSVDMLRKVSPKLDKAEEMPVSGGVIVSRLGDIWCLGHHRLMCGDATHADAMETLLNGAFADLVFTDPPYNVDYVSNHRQNKLGSIQNDAMSDDSFSAWLECVFTQIHDMMRPLACIYVCHPDSVSEPKIAFERKFANLFHKSATLIWVKQAAGMGYQDYRAKHEPILYGWKKGDGKHYFCGLRDKTTIWQIDRDAAASYQHPTQKPVALAVEAIRNSSMDGEIVLDAFGGSGSTLIACEATGRHAHLMELDPRWVDVICRRYEKFTGNHAILAGDMRSFPEIEKSRA